MRLVPDLTDEVFDGDFNPRTPCGVRRSTRSALSSTRIFQSTHPLRGATGGQRYFRRDRLDFNPRTPCGVRPLRLHVVDYIVNISIHAPLAGCDFDFCCLRTGARDFNPRTPCGVRPLGNEGLTIASVFQSTHPLRGATDTKQRLSGGEKISIHAPLAGCDFLTAPG